MFYIRLPPLKTLLFGEYLHTWPTYLQNCCKQTISKPQNRKIHKEPDSNLGKQRNSMSKTHFQFSKWSSKINRAPPSPLTSADSLLEAELRGDAREGMELRLLMVLSLCVGALQEEEKQTHFYVEAAVGQGGKVLVASLF